MRRTLTWMTTLLVIAAVGGMANAEGAGDSVPKSVQAAAAKYDRSIQQAAEEARKKTKEARAKLVAEIDNAVKDVAKRGDQDELARLIEYRKSLPPEEEAAFSVKQLINRPLHFFRLAPGAGRLTLLADGTVGSDVKNNTNEKTWRISKEGSLQLLNGSGQVTSEYNDYMRSGSNLLLWGPFGNPADGILFGLTTIEPAPAK